MITTKHIHNTDIATVKEGRTIELPDLGGVHTVELDVEVILELCSLPTNQPYCSNNVLKDINNTISRSFHHYILITFTYQRNFGQLISW